MLQPLDIVLALKLAVNDKSYTQAELATELNISASQVNRALKQCQRSDLVNGKSMRINRTALTEFLIHGVKYVYPGTVGATQRGMPTAYSAPPLESHIGASNHPIVWPDPAGEMRGESLEPLYKNVPSAAKKDAKLYEALALLDAIRIGRARERNIAAKILTTCIVRSND